MFACGFDKVLVKCDDVDGERYASVENGRERETEQRAIAKVRPLFTWLECLTRESERDA